MIRKHSSAIKNSVGTSPPVPLYSPPLSPQQPLDLQLHRGKVLNKRGAKHRPLTPFDTLTVE